MDEKIIDQKERREVIIEKSDYTEFLSLKLEKQSYQIEELKKENIKLINNSNKEWIEKYKKYKHNYYDTKKELKDTKLELKQMKQEMDNLKMELENLKNSMKKLKGKNKKSYTSS